MHRNVKRIILCRHGESVGNIDPTAYSRLPDNKQPLTEWGRSQSLRAGRTLLNTISKSKNRDCRFFISPYVRSHQTYELISRSLPKDSFSCVEDPRLREQDWGNFQDKEHMAWQNKERRRFGVFYYRFSEGESGADVFDRVSSFMETLIRDSRRAKPTNYVLISHGITIRMFLARYYHWDVQTLNRLHNLQNSQMVVMERADAKKKQYTNVHPQSFDQIQGEEDDIVGSRFLLTSLLMSDPPGPPAKDVWWEKIDEHRKTHSPLLGL
eukprot:maker-scaffold_25-snap-gene-4.1-mRNA-1 protein AED:0.24 eAED:0.24 QI:67/1/1/1/1/1/2/776/266